ncbi:MAG: winged helix-turn-helix transcriptional regulator [Flavobacteriaceae bacterium]|jgi:DNA-binding HxlR family transcriptional regulator
MKIADNRSGCPISTTLDLFGDRWSLLIVRNLFIGRMTFSDFLEAPEKIASNILRDRLKKLLFYEIIEYKVHARDKKIKQYYLTDKGIDLFPILHNMSIWSTKHLEFELHPLAVETIEENKDKSYEQIIEQTTSTYREAREKLVHE